jgi:AI-2 transport system ATP-binding protein
MVGGEFMEGTRRLVKLEDIHKSFNQSKVLKGVSLEVCESEVISIVGGNGAGKSTLMKILSGVYKADHGNIEIEGEKMVHLHPSLVHEKGIYLVPQEPLLFPNMTVAQNLCIGMKKRKAEVREKANLLMEQLDWRLELNRVALSLSIAEQQQVEIIKGLLRDAKVLILDEPTSSLTFAETQALFRIIEKLRASGAGIIYITHRLDEVFQISTHAAILRDGKVTLKGKIARGIDAAARNDIYTIITQLKEQGTSILLISSDLEEIERVSDRVYAIYRGTCRVCLKNDEINAENVMSAAFGTYKGWE